jgi:uncharacterized protein (DUF58 family)
MRLFYIWQEGFTQVGHAAAALLMFSMFAGAVPGFWAAWVFCGLDFMYFLALVPSLFMTARKSKFKAGDIAVRNVYEGEIATVSLQVHAVDKLNAVSLGCFRMDSSLLCEESALVPIAAGETAEMTCRIQTKKRGAFEIPKVSVIAPEINGALRYAADSGKAELLVFPRPLRVSAFPFLTSGASGVVFAPLLMPSLTRGMDFVGVREYREGDSLRDLHHKAFARYGKPFTKEFEVERGAGVILLLDTATPNFKSRQYLEHAIRMTAAVGEWLLDREILGRFFIDSEEIALDGGSESRKNLLDALARIPPASLAHGKLPAPWAPAARPMDPVLRIGLYENDESLVNKHIVVGTLPASTEDKLLIVSPEDLNGERVTL